MQIASREELVNALMDAAELEHNLACLYLFAFYSLKKKESEINNVPAADIPAVFAQVVGWGQKLRKIAHQEMGHLATISNLLSLLGAEAHFDRPNFPPPAGYYPPTVEFILERFSLSALKRLVEFERNASSPGVQMLGLAPRNVAYQHVGELYTAIADAFKEIADGGIPIPNDQLFLGYRKPMDQSWGGSVEVHHFGLAAAPATPLDQLRSKVREALIDVIEEGEGSPAPGEDSHYEELFKVATELQTLINKYPGFDPARAVATNPMVQRHRGTGSAITLITAQPTKDIAELFNAYYGTMVLALRQMFAFTEDLSSNPRRAELHWVCLNLMRHTIGPLGAHLTSLPLASGTADRAGAGFELYRPMYISTQQALAWAVIVERLRLASAECARLLASGTLSADTAPVLTQVQSYTESIITRITSWPVSPGP